MRQTLTSIPFDYLLISSWVTNFVSSREFLSCHFILDRIDRELHSLKSLDLKFGLSSEWSNFFDKIPVRILLDVLFCVFRFSKASFCALTSLFRAFLNFVAILTLRRTKGCHGILFHMWNYKLTLKFRAIILLRGKFLQFGWLRAVVFQLHLKYLHVKITNLLRAVV